MNTTRTCPQCQQPLPADAPEGLCPACVMQNLAATQPGDPTQVLPRRAPLVDIADPAEIARRLPQFEIIALLGRGGMGVVYKARQKQLDREVAIKILPLDDSEQPDFVERFRREARSLAKLNHPNIVTVHDFGESDGLYYFIMEFVDGANLRQLLRTKKITADEALAIVPKVCDALEYAHEEGVVHRDIKPENILVDKKGRVKIADFGLAKLLRREALDVTLTLAGSTLGTLRYMAPEQVDKPETVDHRADIYSLGVVIYEMLTGETPVGRFQLPSQKAQVDTRLDDIVLHALEKEPDRRYQHASEIKTDVENVTQARSHPPAGSSSPPMVEAPAPQAHAHSATDFKRQDASEILRVIMVILMGTSVLGTLAGIVGFARVIVPTIRPEAIPGAAESLGRDALQFLGILILSLMGLYLLPKARREGRDRLARVVATDLVIMGAMLTLACEKQWFGPAVPYWVGGLVSIASFVCWLILRGQAVREAFVPSTEESQAASGNVARSKLQRAAIGLLLAGIADAIASLIWIGINVNALINVVRQSLPIGEPVVMLLLSLCSVAVVYYTIGSALFLMHRMDDGDITFPLIVAAIAPPGCIFGLPAAIYALVLLSKPEVKVLFPQPAPETSSAKEKHAGPRLSRCALWAAIWAAAGLLAVIPLVIGYIANKTPGGVMRPPDWFLNLAVVLGIVIASAVFGATILGGIATAQIKRSGGILYGLRLAAVDALLFPLLAVGALRSQRLVGVAALRAAVFRQA